MGGPSLFLPTSYYLKKRDDPQLMAYQKYASDVAQLLGVPEDVAKSDMKNVVDFEIMLANVSDLLNLAFFAACQHVQINVNKCIY